MSLFKKLLKRVRNESLHLGAVRQLKCYSEDVFLEKRVQNTEQIALDAPASKANRAIFIALFRT